METAYVDRYREELSDIFSKLVHIDIYFGNTKKKALADYEKGLISEEVYKEVNKSETETTINVLYDEQIISVYTNKIELQKQLLKVLGKPTEEYIKGRSIIGTRWDIPFTEKRKISQMMLKANIFEL